MSKSLVKEQPNTMTSTQDVAMRRPSYRAVTLLASGAMFLSILDATITNLAVADLHRSFPRSSITDFSWVISLYAILFASFLAPAGRLADVIGRRSLFTLGVGLFTAMSLLCSLAPTLPTLLLARALQAIGAAAMVPASLAVVLVDSPPERRAAAIGLWAASASAAAAAGPSLGGILIDAFGWRAVFLINVPIGIVLLIGIRRVHKSGARISSLPDAVGTILLATGVGLLTLGVTEGPTWHWSSVRVFGCLISGVALLALAIVRSRHHAVPAIETQLWRNRTYALANVVSLFFGATLYAWLLISALIALNVWHFSWLAAGLAMSPGALVAAVVAMLVGRILRRHNPGMVIFLGAVPIVCGAIWMMLALSSQPHFLSLFLPVGVLAGLGMGAVSTGVSTAAALSVAPAQFAGATGLNFAVRQTGGALGIAALAAILPPQISSDPAPHISVFLFCCITAVATGLVGLGLLVSALPKPQASVQESRGGGQQEERMASAKLDVPGLSAQMSDGIADTPDIAVTGRRRKLQLGALFAVILLSAGGGIFYWTVSHKRDVPITDLVVVSNGQGMRDGGQATIQIPGIPPQRRHLAVILTLTNPASVGDCVNTARLDITPVIDGQQRSSISGLRSGQETWLDLTGATRRTGVVIILHMPDPSCTVNLDVSNAILHN